MNIKQVIVVREDLDMPTGKIASQVAHAATAYLTTRINYTTRKGHYLKDFGPALESYVKVPTTKKVILGCESEAELLELCFEGAKAGIEVHLIKDEGLTVFDGVLTTVCAAFGSDYSDDIDIITGHLETLE